MNLKYGSNLWISNWKIRNNHCNFKCDFITITSVFVINSPECRTNYKSLSHTIWIFVYSVNSVHIESTLNCLDYYFRKCSTKRRRTSDTHKHAYNHVKMVCVTFFYTLWLTWWFCFILSIPHMQCDVKLVRKQSVPRIKIWFSMGFFFLFFVFLYANDLNVRWAIRSNQKWFRHEVG